MFLLLRVFCDRINGVSLICKQIFRIDSFDKMFSLTAIRAGSLCDKHSCRHTMHICGLEYFGIGPFSDLPEPLQLILSIVGAFRTTDLFQSGSQ